MQESRQPSLGWLAYLAAAAPVTAGIDELALVDTDETIKASYRYKSKAPATDTPESMA